MLKRWKLPLLLALLLTLAACGGGGQELSSADSHASSEASAPAGGEDVSAGTEEAAEGEPVPDGEGLLTEEEIALYESLYFAEDKKTAEALGLTEEKLNQKVMGMVLLDDKRKIAGAECWVTLLFSETEPKGLYGVRIQAGIPDTEQARETVMAMYEQAVALYGEPNTFEGYVDSARLSQRPEGFQSAYETWSLGEKTDLTLTYRSAEGSEDSDDMDLIELTYQVRILQDGQPIDPAASEPGED